MPSFVWSLVKKISSKTARCNLCSSDIQYCGHTTNIHRHLKEKHLPAYKAKQEELNWRSGPSLCSSTLEEEEDDPQEMVSEGNIDNILTNERQQIPSIVSLRRRCCELTISILVTIFFKFYLSGGFLLFRENTQAHHY